MFSPATCNFFVPFAQKDARFGSAANRRAADAEHTRDKNQIYDPPEMKA
jgi:hypothetical protein